MTVSEKNRRDCGESVLESVQCMPIEDDEQEAYVSLYAKGTSCHQFFGRYRSCPGPMTVFLKSEDEVSTVLLTFGSFPGPNGTFSGGARRKVLLPYIKKVKLWMSSK